MALIAAYYSDGRMHNRIGGGGRAAGGAAPSDTRLRVMLDLATRTHSTEAALRGALRARGGGGGGGDGAMHVAMGGGRGGGGDGGDATERDDPFAALCRVPLLDLREALAPACVRAARACARGGDRRGRAALLRPLLRRRYEAFVTTMASVPAGVMFLMDLRAGVLRALRGPPRRPRPGAPAAWLHNAPPPPPPPAAAAAAAAAAGAAGGVGDVAPPAPAAGEGAVGAAGALPAISPVERAQLLELSEAMRRMFATQQVRCDLI